MYEEAPGFRPGPHTVFRWINRCGLQSQPQRSAGSITLFGKVNRCGIQGQTQCAAGSTTLCVRQGQPQCAAGSITTSWAESGLLPAGVPAGDIMISLEVAELISISSVVDVKDAGEACSRAHNV